MLLSLYKGDPKIIQLLQRRRRSYKDVRKAGDYSFAPQHVSLDLALTEMGQNDALQRVQGVFKRRKMDELLALLNLLKFVENRTVLLQVVELLKDRSNARRTGPSHGTSTYTRWSDEALVALATKTGYKLPSLKGNAPVKFSDKELADAYKFFQNFFRTAST